MAKRKMTKGQPTIYKTLHEKLIIGQHEPYQNMFLMALRNSYYYNKLTFLLYAHLFFCVETYIVSIFVCFCYSIGKV